MYLLFTVQELASSTGYVIKCNMDICSGSCSQNGAMNFICLSDDYLALPDLISCLELLSDSGNRY